MVGLQLDLVRVEIRVNNTSIHDDFGLRGLRRDVIAQLSESVGAAWCDVLSQRLDDGSDRYYCRYKAVGAALNVDGTPRTIVGEYEIDVRPGSQLVLKSTSQWIRELRSDLTNYTECAARMRALRQLGVRCEYAEQELPEPLRLRRRHVDTQPSL